MRPILCGLWCALALALATTTWGNSTPTLMRGINGKDVVPIRNREIRMVREIVNIDCAWTTYSVQADFWFKNTTDKSQDVQFGFPIDYIDYDEDNEALEEVRAELKVSWNGQPVSFALSEPKSIDNDGGPSYRCWISWKASFAPGEAATNQVYYEIPMWAYDPGSTSDGPYAYLKYILKTGAAWAGPIESSTVRIHYGHSLPRFMCYDQRDANRITIYPKGYIWNKKMHTITWEFKDFVPDRDIFFGWGDVPDFKYLDKDQPINIEEAPAQ